MEAYSKLIIDYQLSFSYHTDILIKWLRIRRRNCNRNRTRNGVCLIIKKMRKILDQLLKPKNKEQILLIVMKLKKRRNGLSLYLHVDLCCLLLLGNDSFLFLSFRRQNINKFMLLIIPRQLNDKS